MLEALIYFTGKNLFAGKMVWIPLAKLNEQYFYPVGTDCKRTGWLA